LKSLSSDARGSVLSGASASGARAARLDSDLRRSPYAQRFGTDPRLVDPQLERAFVETDAKVRKQAQIDGFARGLAEGRAAGLAAAAADSAALQHVAATELDRQVARVREVLGRLAAAADALESRMAPVAAEVEEQVATIALGLLESLLQRELAVATEPGMDAVRRALALAPRGRPVVARLHPADAAALPADAFEVDGRRVTVVADASVEPGGCIADCDATRVDAQLGAALERVRAVLQP
jgi:flagellar assembly protein FliH